MKIDGPLIKGNFIDRPNRFLTIVKIKDKYVKSHLPDPGRLKEILTPGRVLFLRKDKFTTNRKTRYTTVLTDINGELVSLISTLPNQFIKECIELNCLSFLDGSSIKKQEIRYGKHRFDFLLTDKKNIQFLSTAFDNESVDLLAELNISFYKIPSGEITNLPYLIHVGRMDKPDVDYIEGLSPAISIDQKGVSHNPRSTVGTVTEIYD